MSAEENKALVRRLVDAWNTRNWPALEGLMAAGYVDHNPLPGQKPGRQGYMEAQISFISAFPDIQIAVEDIFAEGGRVATRFTFNGRHRGLLRLTPEGIAPTNKQVSFGGIVVQRVVDGKLTEEWSEIDILGLLEQLDAVTIKTAPKYDSGSKP